VPRNLVLVSLFVLAVVLATAVSAWVAWRGVAGALETEFEQRVGRIAATAAHEIGAADFADARQRAEGGGYLALEVQLVTLRTSTGVANAVLLDPAGVAVVDARDSERAEGRVSALDTLAGAALRRSLAGTPAVSPPYAGPDGPLRAGFAPVRDAAGRVLGAVAVEAAPAYPPVVARLGRTLALIAVVAALAVLLLAAVIVRASRAAARLERRLSRAENLAAMGRLTATLAHEIKNILTPLQLSLQLLERGAAALPGEQRARAGENLAAALAEVDQLARLADQFSQYARLPEPHLERLDLAAVARAAAARPMCEGVGVTCAAGEAVPVLGDGVLLARAAHNLVLNACEASPAGAVVEVAARREEDRALLEVLDRGGGVPAAVAGRVFEPYVSTKRRGSGLGLSLVRDIARQHGGSVTLEDRPGGGARARLVLPLAREDGAPR